MAHETAMFAEDLADSAPVALLALGSDDRILRVNPVAETLFGLSRRNLVSRTLQDVTVASDGLDALIAIVRQTETDAAAGDVLIKPVGLKDAATCSARVKYLQTGMLVLALTPELTHEQTNSLAGVASFGRILGHEIKNPLAGISGAAQLLLRQSHTNQRELLTLICEESARIERMVNRLSAFELFSSPQLASLNIHQTLDRILASEEAAFDGEITVKRRYDPSLPDIQADADHLHEAIQNIVRNGIEAALSVKSAERPPTIIIQTAFETRFTRRKKSDAGNIPGRALRIDIIDSGPGLTPAKRASVFEAFTSSKSVGRGLGLTIVKEVIQAHDGQVQLGDHELGNIVSVFLPFRKGPHDG